MRQHGRAIRTAAVVLAALVSTAGPAAAYDPEQDAAEPREERRARDASTRATRTRPSCARAARRTRPTPRRSSRPTPSARPAAPARRSASRYGSGCAGDIRLYDFQERGRGLVTPVLWTARNGSTVSGRVWATRAGPAKRPLIVITNGSIQAPETLYWWAAQTLAKSGYVVITYDAQEQGRSDTFGDGADRMEGVPSQTAGNTFFDWTQDAIDFALSSPDKPVLRAAEPLRPEPLRQAAAARRGGSQRRLQPVLGHGRPGADRHRRALVRSLGRLVGRPAGHPRRRRRRVGQPVLAQPAAQQRRSHRGSLLARRPGRPARLPRAVARDHQRHVHRQGGEEQRPRPDGEEPRLGRVLERRGRHRIDRDPRRHPLRVLLPAEPRLPRDAARDRPGRLVHERVVRQVRQGRRVGGRAPDHDALAQRPGRSRGRPGRRRQPVLVLLPVAARHRPGGRRALQVRGPAHRLPRPGRPRRLRRALLVPVDRDDARRRARDRDQPVVARAARAGRAAFDLPRTRLCAQPAPAPARDRRRRARGLLAGRAPRAQGRRPRRAQHDAPPAESSAAPGG